VTAGDSDPEDFWVAAQTGEPFLLNAVDLKGVYIEREIKRK
jgi:hypothetical protein